MIRPAFVNPDDYAKFEAQRPWFSYDVGLSWTQEERPLPESGVYARLRVTSADLFTGRVTIEAIPIPAGDAKP